MAGNDLGAILKRIDKRLEIVKLSDRAASIAAGMSPDGIRTMRRQWDAGKQKTATAHTLGMLSRPLQTTTEWLMSGIGAEDFAEARTRNAAARQSKIIYRSSKRRGRADHAGGGGAIKVAGEVAAGTWREAVTEVAESGVTVPAHPDWPASQQYAVVVHGNSINRVATYGDFLMVLDLEASNASVSHGDLVVVARNDNGKIETTAKRYNITADEKFVELRYDSLDPQYDETAVAKIPMRAGSPASKADDGIEIAIKGIVVGIFRLP